MELFPYIVVFICPKYTLIPSIAYYFTLFYQLYRLLLCHVLHDFILTPWFNTNHNYTWFLSTILYNNIRFISFNTRVLLWYLLFETTQIL